jgi:hypothetical protein
MNTQTQPQASETPHAFPAAPLRRIFTLTKFAERHSSFLTLSALTNQKFKSEPRKSSRGEILGNGLAEFGAFITIGRRVLVDEDAYFRWLDAQNRVAKSSTGSSEV